jgi:hypothetical protein
MPDPTPQVRQSESDVKRREITVTLTVAESQGLRMGLIFGVPEPTPEEIISARGKLLAAEREAGHDV